MPTPLQFSIMMMLWSVSLGMTIYKLIDDPIPFDIALITLDLLTGMLPSMPLGKYKTVVHAMNSLGYLAVLGAALRFNPLFYSLLGGAYSVTSLWAHRIFIDKPVRYLYIVIVALSIVVGSFVAFYALETTWVNFILGGIVFGAGTSIFIIIHGKPKT
tara:strand:+ start:211 stop:684 length:474 start_codon:yes stop_codon:yes gene_type:complete